MSDKPVTGNSLMRFFIFSKNTFLPIVSFNEIPILKANLFKRQKKNVHTISTIFLFVISYPEM